MSTVLNPDNNEFIVKGSLTADSLVTTSSGDARLQKISVDSTADIDLTNIPTSYTNVSDPTDPNYDDVAFSVRGGSWIGGNQYVGGTFIANGDVITLGNASGSFTLNANISSHLIPSQTQTYDIGESNTIWRNIHTSTIHLPTAEDIVSSIDPDIANGLVSSLSNASLVLPDATSVGLVKVFQTIDTPTQPVVVTPTNPLGFTSITFNNQGDTATLMYRPTGWAIISVFRASVS